jgi:methylated-DNA-[protein]-cysteine S-methyltransferase
VEYTLFETALGWCGIVWSTRGVSGVHLPEPHEAAARTRLLRRFPGARETTPPPPVEAARDGIVALLRGEPRSLDTVRLDVDGLPELHRRVYEVARTIPPGATLSYGAIAARLGDPGLARDVGQILGENPFSLVVPCHRVIAADGGLGGFSARGGVATKRRLLALEGARVAGQLGLFESPAPRRAP